ncbi:hypothetical protein AB751O23_AC_00270 [Chlamydiales bacterium SCGC AB-751-O23]|jgi:hypothetical protein|nr:hypothetical protein AB751O23_AC_00270 [Chlamydiales bacterium SCGC AB-751-O23]
MNRKPFAFFLTFLFLTFELFATQSSPWFGRDKEIELRGVYLYQNSREIPLKSKKLNLKRERSLANFSLAVSPTANWSTELELALGKVKDQSSFTLSSTKLTARRQFYNDLIGDAVSLTGGFSTTFSNPKHMFNAFNIPYSDANAEVHLAFGKEKTLRDSYSRRYYGLIAYGVKNKGPSWVRLKLNLEKNFRDKLRLEIFTEGAIGIGKEHQLVEYHSDQDFARNNFKFLDLGLKFHYPVDFIGEWNLTVLKRIHGKYVPSKSFAVNLAFFIPFFP